MNEIAGETEQSADADQIEIEKAYERARLLDVKLIKLGLNLQAIENYDLHDLEESLVRINSAIDHPEQFGDLMLEIKPILTQRKGLISSRIRNLQGDLQIDDLKGLVASVTDSGLRSKIVSELEELQQKSREAADRDRDIQREQFEQIAVRNATIAKLNAETLERKLVAWKEFLARESMATYVGALLLLVLTIVQIVILFMPGHYDSKTIESAFLLLLGYFFGQSTTKATMRPR